MIPIPLIAAGATLIGGAMTNRANTRSAERINAQSIQQAYDFNKQNVRIARDNEMFGRRQTGIANNMARNQFRSQSMFAKSQAQFAREQWEYSKRDQVTESEGAIDYERLRADAKAGGFNPMTLLATGAYGTSKTTASGGSTPVGSVSGPGGTGVSGGATGFAGGSTSGPPLAVPQASNPLGDAASVFSQFTQQPDPEREALEKALMAEELNQMKTKAAPVFKRDMGYSIPSVTQTSGRDPANVSTNGPAGGGSQNTGVSPAGSEMPYFDEPTTYMDDTGIPRANPENPRELEADAWDWALDGTLMDNFKEIYKRNTNYNRERWDSDRPLRDKIFDRNTPKPPLSRDSRRSPVPFNPNLHFGDRRPGW